MKFKMPHSHTSFDALKTQDVENDYSKEKNSQERPHDNLPEQLPKGSFNRKTEFEILLKNRTIAKANKPSQVKRRRSIRTSDKKI